MQHNINRQTQKRKVLLMSVSLFVMYLLHSNEYLERKYIVKYTVFSPKFPNALICDE
jgi:hypothetical protein